MGNSESATAMRSAAERLSERSDGDAAARARIDVAGTVARVDWPDVPRSQAGLTLAAMTSSPHLGDVLRAHRHDRHRP